MDNSEVWWAAKALENSTSMDRVWFQLGMLYVIYGLAMGNTEDDILGLAAQENPDGSELSRRMIAWHERFIDANEAKLGKGA